MKSKLHFLFVATVLHGLGHCILRWYGDLEEIDGSQLEQEDKDAGNFIEVEFFGGISTVEFSCQQQLLSLQDLKELGIRGGGKIYPIGKGAS